MSAFFSKPLQKMATCLSKQEMGAVGKERSEVCKVDLEFLLASILLAKQCVRLCLCFGVSPCTSDNPVMYVRLLPFHLCWGLGGEEEMGKGLLI